MTSIVIMRRTNYAFYISPICVVSLFASNFFTNLINSFVNTALGKSKVRYVLSWTRPNQIGTELISGFNHDTVTLEWFSFDIVDPVALPLAPRFSWDKLTCVRFLQ